MANINITTEELQKVLKGTGISEKHFLVKLSTIKMAEYKRKKKHKAGEKKMAMA